MPEAGLRANNAYLVGGDFGVSVIDPGLRSEGARSALEAGLSMLGAGLGDLDVSLVTHAHRDHYPMAVQLRRLGYGRVLIGDRERPTFEGLQAIGRPRRAEFFQRLQQAGAPQELVETSRRGGLSFDVTDWEDPDGWLEDGSVIGAGDRQLLVIHTPGHTRGHYVFHDQKAGFMFTGDHVLPHITPSIGLEEAPPRSPLTDFINSLRLLREGPDALMLPGHGVVGGSVHARVDALLAHHDTRLEHTLAALRAGAETAYDVTRALRWTRRSHQLEELGPFERMLAIFETHWHLVLLAERRSVSLVPGSDPFRYHA
jgi:glyoxylase-like metal-dependent hydrolase (beta-lactamase superfamily II)